MRRSVLGILLTTWAAAAGTFTLEEVLSAPFPSELVAAPGGGKVAWLLNERGARNIWMAAAPDYKGVRLTAYKDDDGIDIGQLHWMPDASAVVYVRGGDLEFPGRPDPNPSADPGGAEQAIWMCAPGGAPRKIADGHSPAISPKGDRVAYLKGGQIWLAAINSGSSGGASDGRAGGEAGPALLFHPRSGVTSAEMEWSPDGSRLAFVSDRVNHSFVTVYDFAAKSLTYLDPSVDHDRDPVWSPDGKQIAFLRMPASGGGRGGAGARRAGEPWSIRVADAATGAGRQIWISEKGPGSVFHPMVSEHQLYWAAGDRLVFPWERNGWQHLYAVAVEGGKAALLTPGEFEVETVALTEDRREALFSSNQNDIDRRHIWRVALAAAAPVEKGEKGEKGEKNEAPKAVTSGDGLEWAAAPVANGVAFLRSGAKQPARAAILLDGALGGAIRDLAPDSIPAGFPADALVVPQQVIYTASDGMPIHGQLFLPPGSRPGQKHAALVFMHGGSRRQMLLGWHYMDYYNNAYGMNQYLASQGYVVLSINYRSGIGYGLNFREAINYGPSGASEYHDVEGAGLYLKSRPDVDPAHIGLWGGSYGGYLTALGLARGSDLFAAGVDFHGVHDWTVRNAANAAAQDGPANDAARQEAARVAFASSPMASVRTWRSPVLLIHGDDDRNVNFSETVAMAAALRQQGVYFEQLIFPDEIHGFLRHQSWLKGYRAAADFFKRKL